MVNGGIGFASIGRNKGKNGKRIGTSGVSSANGRGMSGERNDARGGKIVGGLTTWR